MEVERDKAMVIVSFKKLARAGLIAAGDSQLPDGQIMINAAMFFLASMFMIAEAWNSYKRKKQAS